MKNESTARDLTIAIERSKTAQQSAKGRQGFGIASHTPDARNDNEMAFSGAP